MGPSIDTRIFVFGDQTTSFDDGLFRLLHIQNNPILTSFVERATYALRLEIGRLPTSHRDLFPRFISLIELLSRYRKYKHPNPALESCLVCLHQLACFIGYFGEGSRTYPDAASSYAIGLCTGLLAAAAISAARTVVELVPAAVEAVLVAFRTGLRTIDARNLVEQETHAASSSWSVVVSLQEQHARNAIKAFCESTGLPPPCHPYLSVINANNVTISGSPAILDQLLHSPSFSDLKLVKVSVYAPYHASQFYTTADVDAILDSCSKELLDSPVSGIKVFENSTGAIVTDSITYGTLLRTAVREMLIEPIRFAKVTESCKTALEKARIHNCTIFPVATNASQSLVSLLSQDPKIKVTVESAINGINIPPPLPSPGRPERSKIAIIGYSGRFPDAASPDLFWELLHKGLDVHRVVPADRFDYKLYYDPTGKKKNTSQIIHGCWIEQPGLFDARFFNMSPREADNTDPGQRLALLTAYEALEMAGVVPNRTPSTQCDRVGIFYGMTSDDWREVNSGQNVDTYFIPGGNRAFTPGRINYHFKFSGPSLSIDTACSSSFAAIHSACNALWRNDCDTAIAGGTNVLTNPDNFAGLDRGHFLSRTGNCNTFDDAADGYCRADAVGTIVMKRYEDAVADNDPIYGVILGACTNHSAEAVSMTRPHVGAQAYIFDKLLNEAGIDPLDVSYIEMHGTGTQAGDAVEMKSVLDIFSPPKRKRASHQSLHLGSAKANVGHAESASGVTSMVKVLMMMQKNEIPPHPGIKTKINRNFPTDLKEQNIHIALKPTPWHRKGGEKRRVFMNNFSAAGGNTALLMEDAPLPEPISAKPDPRSAQVVTISAKSIRSLKDNVAALASFIGEKESSMSLPSLSYTTTARRMHHNHRVTVSGSTLKHIKEGLEAALSKEKFTPIPAKHPYVAFAFTGQGALYLSMGKQLYESFSQFRNDIQRFDAIGKGLGFPSITPLIDGTITQLEDVSPLVAQLGTTCMQIALARLWALWGVKPTAVVGHSLGEYAALNVAGVLSTSDAIYLTGKRAQLLQEACSAGTHAMLATKASVEAIDSYLQNSPCEIACINAPEETVISGTSNDIDSLQKKLSDRGFKCIKLKVPFAFHSAQVEPILDSFEKAARGVTFHRPSIPVISPLLSNVVNTDSDMLGPSYLVRACRETVNFYGGIQSAVETKAIENSTIWIEIGSHPVCAGMIKSILGTSIMALPSLKRQEDTWQILVGTLASLHNAGVEIKWDEYHRDFESCHQVVKLPAYSWDYKNHWIQYVHDWCLTKGSPPTAIAPKAPEPSASTLSTTAVQRVIEEHFDPTKASIIIESDLSDPELSGVIQGHKVNGAALCPSSLYADIALTLADHLLTISSKHDPGTSGMDVCEMTVEKPIIAHGNGKQLFRASGEADWATNRVRVKLYTVTSEGKKIADHASCTVKYGDSSSWLRKWKRNEYLIKSQIEKLKKGVEDGQSHKMHRGMAYKLFGALVDYDKRYRGMDYVILDSSQYEATAKVVFQTTKQDGTFYFSPYWIDSLGHISGFVMNANDAVDSKSQVFINHGWESMRCATRFSREKTYQTYVRMQNLTGTMFGGDVYIFEDDAIAAVYKGVKFQGVPRQVLDSLLPPQRSRAQISAPISSSQAPVTKPTRQTERPPTPPVSPMPGKSNGQSTASQAIAIIAEEVGVAVSELSNESNFADFGLDSLLSLTVTGRLREELDLDVGSNLFVDHPTVRELIEYLLPKHTRYGTTSPVSDSRYSPTPANSTASTADEADDNGTITIIRQTLSEEIGVPADEIGGSSRLAELGMDSLLALTVLGRLREQLNVDLPSDLLLGDATLNSISDALGLKPATKSAHSTRLKVPALPDSGYGESPTPSPLPTPLLKPVTRYATSILLSGNPKTAKKILWLFPDGSGSSTSYAPIPKIGSDVAVYGLNCPYMKTPHELPPNINLLTPLYLAEVCRRQPKGPYYLGGWSAGGICAFDAAQQLMSEGEKVERLIMFDSPCPIGLEKLPPRLFDFLNGIGLFGTGEKAPPEWLFPHFLSFVDALDAYQAQPFTPGAAPQTHIIWAKDGVCKNPGDPRPELREDDPREMRWLLENRTELGGNGWERLIPGEGKLKVEVLENVNHFSMMLEMGARKVGAFVRRAME
ncbi:polyketide synthetase PksP [Kalaharituber pfeilii]|nr:polyketide synthetase PksP [Kalaharituber pfeilii]